MQEITKARLQACGIVDDTADGRGSTKKDVNEEPSELRGKPITTVTRHEMSKAVASIAIGLRVLQSEVRTRLDCSLSTLHSNIARMTVAGSSRSRQTRHRWVSCRVYDLTTPASNTSFSAVADD